MTSLSHWGIEGHESALAYLERVIARGTHAHAYLFVGPSGIGKKTVATLFARSLLCTGSTSTPKPCGTCTACVSSAHGTHPDFVSVGLSADEKEIGVEAMRDLNAALGHTSFFQGYRFAIIDDAEQLTREAANSLLKMLEEPRGNTIVILLATSEYRVLSTIRSRAVIIRYHMLSEDRMRTMLASRAPQGTDLETIMICADGRVGIALRMLDDATFFSERQHELEQIVTLVESETWTSRRRLIEADADLWRAPTTLSLFRSCLVHILHCTIDARRPRAHSGLGKRLEALAGRSASDVWLTSLHRALETEQFVQTTNVQPMFALEQLLFALP